MFDDDASGEQLKLEGLGETAVDPTEQIDGPTSDDDRLEGGTQKPAELPERTSQEIIDGRLSRSATNAIAGVTAGVVSATIIGGAGVMLTQTEIGNRSPLEWAAEYPQPTLGAFFSIAGALLVRATYKHFQNEDGVNEENDGGKKEKHFPRLRTAGKYIMYGSIAIGLVVLGKITIDNYFEQKAEEKSDESSGEINDPDVETATMACEVAGEAEIEAGQGLWDVAIQTLFLNDIPVTDDNIVAVHNHMVKKFNGDDPENVQPGDEHATYRCVTRDPTTTTTEDALTLSALDQLNRDLGVFGVKIDLAEVA